MSSGRSGANTWRNTSKACHVICCASRACAAAGTRVEAEYGEATYRLFEASTQWAVHQFLGRLVPVVYVLSNA